MTIYRPFLAKYKEYAIIAVFVFASATCLTLTLPSLSISQNATQDPAAQQQAAELQAAQEQQAQDAQQQADQQQQLFTQNQVRQSQTQTQSPTDQQGQQQTQQQQNLRGAQQTVNVIGPQISNFFRFRATQNFRMQQTPGGGAPVPSGPGAPGGQSSLDSSASGLASGDSGRRGFGVWSNAALGFLGGYGDRANYDGTLYLAMVGGDYAFLDGKLLTGIAVGGEHTYLNTWHNHGSKASTGVTISPYAGYAFIDQLVLDCITGFSFLSNWGKEGSYPSFRFMVNPNLNFYYPYNNWNLAAVAGFLYANEASEQSATYVGEGKIGAHVGYFFEKWEPFLKANYLYDFILSDDANGPDRDEIEATLGLNYFPTDAWALGLESSYSLFRDHVYNLRFMLNVRYEF